MKATKFLVSAAATAAVIGAIGFTYAQSNSTTTDNPSSSSSTTNGAPASTTGPTGGSTTTGPDTGMNRDTGMTGSTPPSDRSRRMSSDTRGERAARADRN